MTTRSLKTTSVWLKIGFVVVTMGTALGFALAPGSHAIAQEGGAGNGMGAGAASGPGSPGYKFQPARPPPLDGDAFDDDEDAMELGEEGYRPPPPPGMGPGSGVGSGAGPGGGAERPAPAPTFQPAAITSPKKFRFKIVEGEYWQKGQKRGRGNQVHVTGTDEK